MTHLRRCLIKIKTSLKILRIMVFSYIYFSAKIVNSIFPRDTNDGSKQSIATLNKEIDSIDRHWDSDLIFSQKQRPAPVIPTTSGFQEAILARHQNLLILPI